MKTVKCVAAAVALSLATAGTAWADRDEHRGWGGHEGHRGGEHREHGRGGHDAAWLGIPLGILLFSEILAHPPRVDQPPPVVYQPAYYPPAPVYVAPAPAPVVQNYWYYCPSEGNYYPYVRECPGGWQEVVPQPLPR